MLTISNYIEFALSNVADGRAYPVIVPQKREQDFPYVVYAMNSATEEETKDGVSSTTIEEEILCFARDIHELEELAEAVREAMADAFYDWNNQTEAPEYDIVGQTFSAGSEDYSMEHDGYFLPLTYTIETQTN